jgi:hypothetical protein
VRRHAMQWRLVVGAQMMRRVLLGRLRVWLW